MLEGEEQLIKRARDGNARAFDKLYSHYLAPIYRFIYMKVSHREEAEDLTHEVFMSAWQNIGGYQTQGFPFSSWLYQIARNRVIDHYRLKKNEVPLETMPENEFIKADDFTELALERALTLEKVKIAMRRLKDNQQDVLLMRFMEDLSYEEIAKIMGKTAGAVRLIQHRALNQLKEILTASQ